MRRFLLSLPAVLLVASLAGVSMSDHHALAEDSSDASAEGVAERAAGVGEDGRSGSDVP